MTAQPIRRHNSLHERNGSDPLKVKRFLPVVFDGVGAILTTGIKGDISAQFDCDILVWRLLADQAGSIVVDIWKAPYGSYPPTVADTITGSDLPTLSGVDKNESTALTGWTTSVTAGDTFRFHIDSVSTVTRVTLTLQLVT